MDIKWLKNKIKKEIQQKCPQLTKKIINDFVSITFWGTSWIIYDDNKELYILGLAESKDGFYYVGCNEKLEIQLISCLLDVKKNKDRDNDYITTFNTDFKLWSKEADNNWRTIRKNIKEYFKNHKDEKLIHFRDHILSNEHIVYENEEQTKYHIEEL